VIRVKRERRRSPTNTEDYERSVDAQFASTEQDLRVVKRGFALADLVEEGNPVSDLMQDLTPRRVTCRVEGCENDAPQFGRYAGRCEAHRHSIAASNDAENGDGDVAREGPGLGDDGSQPEPGEYGYEEPDTTTPFAGAVVRLQQAKAEFLAARKALVDLVAELGDVERR
jgi:hypothetical protein